MNAKQKEYAPSIQEQEQFHVDAVNAQMMISNGNNRAAGTLQQLGVGNSTVEVQGNGRHSFLNIVKSNTNVIDNEDQERPENTGNLHFCSHCHNGFRTLGAKKTHERACLRKRSEESIANRQCKECHKIFRSVTNLKAHMKIHAGIQQFRCKRCYTKFFDEGKYSAHMDRHKRQDELVVWGIALSAQHVDKELVVKEFKCTFCKHNFTAAFDVGQEKRLYSCDACHQKYRSLEVQRQRQPRELACDRCGRQFVLHGYLQRHQLTCDGTLKRPSQRR